MFIVIEGIDGSGKSTQAKILADKLNGLRDQKTLLSAEPTYGKTGKLLREPGYVAKLTEDERLELFCQDRREHLEYIAQKIRDEGYKHVVLDRYFFSTCAYQGRNTEHALKLLHRFVGEFPLPNLTIFLDIEVAAAQSRLAARGAVAAVSAEYETEKHQQKNYAHYQALSDLYTARPSRIISALPQLDALAANCWHAVTSTFSDGLVASLPEDFVTK